MQKDHYIFKVPENPESTVIWRYMDFFKFEDLLNTSTLYLSSMEGMGDEYEGKIPDVIRNEWIQKAFDEGGDEFAESTRKYTTPLKRDFKELFISSWNMNPVESYALWKIYTRDKNAIAIKTTVQKLMKSFDSETDLIQYFGKVTYFNGKDYKFENAFEPFLYKYDYYDFEKEFRLITPHTAKDYHALQTHPKFIRPKVNLEDLIGDIYLAPYADDSHFLEIEKLLVSKGLKKDLFVSGIRDKWCHV